MEKLIREVEHLNNTTPAGKIIDADTILADLILNCDYEISGIAQEIFDIWKSSSDKKSLKELFYILTGITLKNYLEKCKLYITQPKKTFNSSIVI